MCHVGSYASEHVSWKAAKTCYCLRMHAKLTRNEVARALHVGESTLYSWEMGVFPMSKEVFEWYREFLRGVYHDDPFLKPPKMSREERLRWIMNWHSVSIKEIACELGIDERVMQRRLFRQPKNPRSKECIRKALVAIRDIAYRREECAREMCTRGLMIWGNRGCEKR